jgi:protein SCO1/2/putative membrane protein
VRTLHLRALAVTAALFVSAAVAGAGEYVSLEPDFPTVAPFSLCERSGKTITLDDLRGKVWVAHFFFRCCTQGCPQTMAGMMELQRALAGNPDVVLVSVTLDPETDTLAELGKFADEHGADPKQWLFLRSDETAVYTLVEKSFMQPARKIIGADPGQKINHSFRLMLVDKEGRIRGYIRDGREPAQVKELEEHIRFLAGGPLRVVLPRLNAFLNSTCGVLLLIGYAAIRRRLETLHKVCMLSALAVSAAFLASYLYYHFAVLHGQPTRFLGQGWVRILYFGILISHTALAVVVAPMALYTALQGLRDRRPRHVRLARWTLPLWLYVSVTGVIVYLMLYHPLPNWVE